MKTSPRNVGGLVLFGIKKGMGWRGFFGTNKKKKRTAVKVDAKTSQSRDIISYPGRIKPKLENTLYRPTDLCLYAAVALFSVTRQISMWECGW